MRDLDAEGAAGPLFRDDEAGRATAEALLASPRAIARESMDYWRAVVDGSADDRLAARARVALGFDAWDSDRRTRHTNLLTGLRDLWDSDDRIVFAGCLALARSFRTQFRCVEALALLHHARRHSEAKGSPRAQAAVTYALAEVMVDLQEWQRAAELIEQARVAAVAAGPEEAARREPELALLEALSALELGDPDPARRFVAATEDVERGPVRDQRLALRARLLEVEGDPPAAYEVLVRWRDEPPERWHREVYAAFEAARLHLEHDDGEEAEAEAVQFLQRLQRGFADELGAGRRADLATRIGVLLSRRRRRPGTLQLALDVAGAAVLERVAESDSFFRMPPGPLELPDDLAEAVHRHRDRVVEDHRSVLGAAAELASDHPDRVRRLDSEPHSLLRVCAWCRLVAADGGWVPFHRFMPPDGPLKVTHGICPACDRGMRRHAAQ